MVWDKIWTQATDYGLSQSEAFLPLSPECSDVALEHDVMLPIKGECMCALEALHSNIWLWTLGLCLGDPVFCSLQERRAFPQGYSCCFNGKNAFTPYYLLSLFRPHSPCTATTSQLRTLVVLFQINATPPPHWRHRMCSDSIGFLLKPRDHNISWHPWVGGRDLKSNTQSLVKASSGHKLSWVPVADRPACFPEN